MIRTESQAELGLHLNDLFSTLRDLNWEGVAGEELVHRMASKWKKVVGKAALGVLGRKLIICGKVVNGGMRNIVS